MQVTVAVRILREVAIDAVHADIHVNRGHLYRLLPLLRIVVGNDVSLGIEQVALAITLVDRAEIPAVTVIVGELRVLQLRIELADTLEELQIRPLTARRGAFRIAIEHVTNALGRRELLLLGPHGWSIRLVVPHGVAEERIDEHVRLVHVTNHALTGRYRSGERVCQRVPAIILRNRRIHRLRSTIMAELGVRTGVSRIAIVGVDDVTARASR